MLAVPLKRSNFALLCTVLFSQSDRYHLWRDQTFQATACCQTSRTQTRWQRGPQRIASPAPPHHCDLRRGCWMEVLAAQTHGLLQTRRQGEDLCVHPSGAGCGVCYNSPQRNFLSSDTSDISRAFEMNPFC